MSKRRIEPRFLAALAALAGLWGAAGPSAAQTTPDTRTQDLTYSAQNRIASIDGPLPGGGDRVEFTYNAKGYIQTVTDEVGHVTVVSGWDPRGQPTMITDPNGVVTLVTYDMRGRVTGMTFDPGTNQSQWSMTYDAVGNLTRETLPLGGWTGYDYDPAGRLVTTSNNRGDTVAYAPNAMGDPMSVVVRDGGWAVARQESLTYDEMGRPIRVVGAGARTEGYGYDMVSNPVSRTDGRGKVWTTGFDARDRVVAQTDPEGHVVRTGHDALDTLNSFKDGRGLETARAVDGFGWTASEESPDRGATGYTYDAAGRVVKIVDASNVETRFAYDDAGRPTAQTFPAAPGENVAYTYDQTVGGNRGIGRLTQVTDPSGSTAYLYDAQGRVTRVSQTIGTRLLVTGYVYDANGEVTRISLPSGREVDYARAIDGRITAVTTRPSSLGETAALATGVSYRAFGEGLAGLTFGNGLVLSRAFDANGWLTGLNVAGSGAPVMALTLGRDGDGRVVSETDMTAGGARSAAYAYTDDGRLRTGSGPWGQSVFAYDAAGNRTEEHSVRSGVAQDRYSIIPVSSNRLTEVRDGDGAVTRALSYSARGSTRTDVRAGVGAFEYIYNYAGRVVEVQKDDVAVGAYRYDWTGRRVWRSGQGLEPGTRAYVYDLDGRLLAEHDGAGGQVIREYVWVEDMPVAVIEAGSAGPTTLFVHGGPLDEPLMMTDGAGAVVWAAHREPFGTTRLFGTASAALDLRLPGQFLQAETGLHQNWMRDYDPSTGRYLQADPLGIEAGQSLYGYVDQDPLNAVDFDGLQSYRPVQRPVRQHAMQTTYFTPMHGSVWRPQPGSPGSRITSLGPMTPIQRAHQQANQATANRICLVPSQPGSSFQGPRFLTGRNRRAEIRELGLPPIRCFYCQRPLTFQPNQINSLQFDHYIPYTRGGPTSRGNLVPSCPGCNRSKGSYMPWEWGR